MRKLFLLCVFVLTSCSLFQAKEEIKFKNPIFYQRMEDGSTHPHFDFLLTSTTEMSLQRGENEPVFTLPCELLENTENRIIQRCKYDDGDMYTRYTVATDTVLNDTTCWVIRESSTESDFRHKGVIGYGFSKELLPNHDCGPTKDWDDRTRQWLN